MYFLGIPLVYTMDENLEPCDLESENDIGFQAKYLVSAKNHSKVSVHTITAIQIAYI